MSIRDTTIQNEGKKHIKMQGMETVKEAWQRLTKEGYQKNDTYLVVSLPNGQYQVELFLDLEKREAKDSTKPLAELPIPEANLIIRTNTKKSGGEILKWVQEHSHSRVVIVDKHDDFVALFASETAGGYPQNTYIDSSGSGSGTGSSGSRSGTGSGRGTR